MEICITDLSAYNKGHLNYEWVSLPIDEEELSTEIKSILNRGEKYFNNEDLHEEIFISDFECDYMDIGEYDNIRELNQIAEATELLNDDDIKKIKFLLGEGLVSNVEDAIERCDDVNIYQNQTMEDVAYELINGSYDIDELPSVIANNIDYKHIGEELEMDGFYYQVENSIFEFMG